jgi:hypothetical protein
VIAYSAGTTPPRGRRPACAPHSPGTADAGRQGGAASPHQAGWTVRLPAALDLADIPPNYLKMLLVLERACRDRSYCWNSNASLAALYGAANSGGFRRLLADMRRDGFLAMIPVNPDRPGDGRVGIFLLRRLDPDLPVEDRPPSREAVARLWAARERKGEPVRRPGRVAPPAPIEAAPLSRMGQPPLPQMRPQNKDEFSKKDERNDDGVVVAPSRSPNEEKTPGEPVTVPGGPRAENGSRSPGELPEDLGPLAARAQDRFGGCMLNRVADVVEVYGREWVEVVLWGVLTLRDWGGVLATLGHWRTEGGPSDRTAEKARRERSRVTPKPAVERRPAAERPAAEVLLAEIRREGFRLEIGPEGGLELIDPEPVPVEGPRPLVERLRKTFESAVARARSEYRSRLDSLGTEVLNLLRVGSPGPRVTSGGITVAGVPRPSDEPPIVAPRVGTG